MELSQEQRAVFERARARPLDAATGQRAAIALVDQEVPWAGILDPLVLAEPADGGHVALVRAGPLVGYILSFPSDAGPLVVARSLDGYLDAVRVTGELPAESLLDPDGPRSAREELGAVHLVANAFDEDDWTALFLAIPLIRENVGLLCQLGQVGVVAVEAEARLQRVASPQQQFDIAQGSPPAPWPVPDEVKPHVEEELEGWTRSQLGFGTALTSAPVRVIREGETRTLILDGPVELASFLDEAIVNDPSGLEFLSSIGTWGEAEAVGEITWTSPDEVRLTLGDETYDWTRD